MATTKTTKAITKAQKTLYEQTKRNLNILFTDPDGSTVIAMSGAIPTELLEVDEAYQGKRFHKRVRRLVEKWNMLKYDLITVVPHDETCTYEVVDGKGRTIAAKELCIDFLWAKVIMVAPSDKDERRKFEAELFVTQDDEKEKLRPTEVHDAKVLIGDPAAIALDDVLNKYNVTFVNVCGSRSERVLGSYSGALNVAKSYGKDGLEFIFSTIENAGWAHESNGYSSTFFTAMKSIYAAHDTKAERKKIHMYLCRKLRFTSPNQLQADAKSYYPIRDKRMALTLYIDDMLVDDGIVERSYYENGDKDVIVVKASERKTA